MPKLVLRPPALAVVVSALLLAFASPGRAQTSTTIRVPKLDLTDFTLANGLRVLMHEDHSSPIVAIDLWYNAGSKFDPKGKTGLAHMFEHMMDEGTLNMPNGEYRRIIQSAGGRYNASTQNDFARYYTVIPSNQLETVLWLEAERMANLGPTLDSNRFNLEREAVRNEFKQTILGDPLQSAAVATFEALFAGGAYGPPIFGHPADLASATVADLRRFYETYYVPNNAVLVIVGDFNAAQAKAMVQKHLGPIPRGKPIVFPKADTPFHGEKRLVVEHPSGTRGLWAAWRGAKSSSPDRAALLALGSVLGQRLRRVFVEERRVAPVMIGGLTTNFDLQEVGIFQVGMTPNATASATMFEEVMDSVITSIKTNGVTEAEVRRWVASYRMQMLNDMASVTLIAPSLGDGALNQKNPLAFQALMDRAQRVTPAQVQAAAKKYLTADRIVTSIIPTGKFDLISKPNLPYINATPK